MARGDFEGSAEPGPVKKKAPVGAVTTVVEDIPTIASVMSPSGGQKSRPDRSHVAVSGNSESIILDAIKKDPFYTISELKVVVEESIPHSGITWWKVFKILKKNGLVFRKSRFRFARRSWKHSG
jgi:Iap family predicted aminopeptidase